MNRVSIGSDNGLSPIRRQAIIEINAVLLPIWPFRTNFSEILIKIQNFSFTKIHLKISSAKWRPFCKGRDELTLAEVHGKIDQYQITTNHNKPVCLIFDMCLISKSEDSLNVNVRCQESKPWMGFVFRVPQLLWNLATFLCQRCPPGMLGLPHSFRSRLQWCHVNNVFL